MGRFLIVAIVVAVIVIVVLHFTGFDIMGRINGRGAHDVVTSARDFTTNPHFMNNIIAGVISGVIVALLMGMFSRR